MSNSRVVTILCFDGLQEVRDRKIKDFFQLIKDSRGKIIITSRERPLSLTV
jgi:hypothetical protein